MNKAAMFVLMGMALCATEADKAPGLVIRRDSTANPWTHLDFNNDRESFQFAIMSDRTGGMRKGVFARAVEKLNALQPEFVMSVGDLIPGYSEDTTVLNEEWDEFDSIVAQLDMPFFYTPGNHDINNPPMARVWEQRYGRAYYHFLYKNVLFLCLNSEDSAYSHITDQQAGYVRRTLEEHEDARWTFVFLHKPFWARADSTAWLKVEPLLQGRDYTVFAGHQHNYIAFERNGRAYYQLATTGGGSQLQGAEAGTFDHLVWVTMQDDGPRVAVLTLDGILLPEHRTEQIARLQHQLRRDIKLRVEPLYAKKRRVSEFATSMVVANAAEQAVRIAGSLTAGGFALARPESLAATIEPGEEQRFEITLKADRPRQLDKLRPAQLRWEATYADTKAAPVVRRGQRSLRPAKVHHCPRRKGKVQVDGNLDDWKELRYECTDPAQVLKAPRSWRGPEDCRFSFDVAHDKNHVYIAIDVFDDTLVAEPDGAPWTQDGVEVRIDARPDSIRAHGRSEGEFTEIMLFALSPAENDSDMVVINRDKLPEGSRCVSRPTDRGYATEIAVPVAWLNGKQGRDWEAFRLSVAVDDADLSGTVAQLWWLPEWRGNKTYAGSGTFRKAR
jgi:hypothetical protein